MHRPSLLLAKLATLVVFVSAVAAASPVKDPFYVVVVDTRPGMATYVTLLPPDVFFSHGIPPEAIVGQLVGGSDEITSANFARNSIFVAFLHAFIQRAGRQDEELQRQANAIRNGLLPLIDRRARGNAEPENVFGTFKVVGGSITSYERNLQHRILAESGFFQLPSSLQQRLVQELQEKARSKR